MVAGWAPLSLAGNIIPATAGKHSQVVFVTGADIDDLVPGLTNLQKAEVLRSVERIRADDTTMHLLSLPASDETPLCWLGDEVRDAIPEVCLTEVGSDWQATADGEWEWTRSWRIVTQVAVDN